MKKYRIDHAGFILKQLADDTKTSSFVVEANYNLADLILTHSFNNYRCQKYQYVDADNYNTNAIKLHGIADSKNNIIDVLTVNSLTTPDGAELTESQALNLSDNKGIYLYQMIDGVLITKTSSDKLPAQKSSKNDSLKKEYLLDILWTDSAKMFYDKFVNRNPSDTTKDSWFENVMKYWNESRIERELNKTALTDATTITAASAVTYRPTHVKARSTLE